MQELEVIKKMLNDKVQLFGFKDYLSENNIKGEYYNYMYIKTVTKI